MVSEFTLNSMDEVPAKILSIQKTGYRIVNINITPIHPEIIKMVVVYTIYHS